MDILIVHGSSAFREEIKRVLEPVLTATDGVIDVAGNESTALKKVHTRRRRPYAVLITAFELPMNANSAVDSAHRGLTLLQNLPDLGHRRTICFILTPAELPQEVELLKLKVSCRFLKEGPEALSDIKSAVQATLSGTKEPPHVSITLEQDVSSFNWKLSVAGGADFPTLQRKATLEIHDMLIELLARQSTKIPNEGEWLKSFAILGEDLYRTLFLKDFRKLWDEAIKDAGGMERVSIAFVADRKHYELALEALVDPNPKGQSVPPGSRPFWMLRMPIYRRLVGPDSPLEDAVERRLSLFHPKHEAVNVLIIEANARGVAELPGGGNQPFNRLAYITLGCEQVEQLMQRRKQAWRIGKIKRISPRTVPRGMSFKEHMHEVLKMRNWHVVYFAGHSGHYVGSDGEQGAGYFVFPGDPVELVDARVFANWISSAQLVFLGSCESSSASFAFEMARNNIPSVVGFRWKVIDVQAADFARSFFKSLFLRKSVESAFVHARKVVRRKHTVESQIWAAPMLVLVESQSRVEGKASAAVA